MIFKNIRARILQEINEEGRDSPKESRFTLIDYRNIAMNDWLLFKDTLGQGKANAAKDKQTSWLSQVNEIRTLAAHPTKGMARLEDVQFLREQARWLQSRLSAERPPSSDSDETELLSE